MKKLTIIAIAALLVACSSSPTVEMSTPKSVVLGHINPNKTVDNLTLAEQECQKYGKHAVSKGTNKKDKTATFECKDS